MIESPRSRMAQENVHEIQLNGKQLVFLFMTAVAAAVVIFLCGVMVGQRVNVAASVQLAEGRDGAAVDPTAGQPLPRESEAVPEVAPDVDTPFEPSFPGRLDAEEPVRERAPRRDAAAASRATPAQTASPERASSPLTITPPPNRPAATAPSAPEPQDDGFAVQVAAVGARGEAEAIARRLADKGFPSFVTAPESGTVQLFRVRVGKYQDRAEAETVARRLEQEEQFKPWITR